MGTPSNPARKTCGDSNLRQLFPNDNNRITPIKNVHMAVIVDDSSGFDRAFRDAVDVSEQGMQCFDHCRKRYCGAYVFPAHWATGSHSRQATLEIYDSAPCRRDPYGEQVPIQDTQIKAFCGTTISSQQAEIDQMKANYLNVKSRKPTLPCLRVRLSLIL